MSDIVRLDAVLAASCSSTILLQIRRANPDLTALRLAEKTDQNPRTVKAHLLGQSAPSLPAFLRYAHLLGPVFAEPVLSLAGLCGLRRVDGTATPGEALCAIAVNNLELARAWSDGAITPQERKHLIPILYENIETQRRLLTNFENANRRAGI